MDFPTQNQPRIPTDPHGSSPVEDQLVSRQRCFQRLRGVNAQRLQLGLGAEPGAVVTHRIHGAGIYTDIGGILMVNVTIYSILGDPMGSGRSSEKSSESCKMLELFIYIYI